MFGALLSVSCNAPKFLDAEAAKKKSACVILCEVDWAKGVQNYKVVERVYVSDKKINNFKIGDSIDSITRPHKKEAERWDKALIFYRREGGKLVPFQEILCYGERVAGEELSLRDTLLKLRDKTE